jgi:catechol 2,3-dioxygenase-like lactoylglutathione lyase family enzyme
MSSTPERSETAIETPKARPVDMKLEVIVIPVSDVDRAKRFYGNLGWRLEADFADGDDFRVIQFTPPGSGASVIFGKNVSAAAPGSAQGLYLIVSDIAAARTDLLGRGVAVGDLFHDAGSMHAGPDQPYLFGRLRVNGLDPSIEATAPCVVQGSGRQRLAVPGGYREIARACRGGRHDIRLVERNRGRAPPGGGRARRA